MGKASSSSSSSINSCKNPSNSTSSSLSHQNSGDLRTDLRLGLSISATQHVGSSSSGGHWQPVQPHLSCSQVTEVNDCSDYTSFFVKVYMEGIPIGRKLNLLAHDGYHELVKALEQMFDTTILCKV
uniref:Auxin-induced protein n=1 Tax=Cajanus cajan TaxID=3821 RepID=A0A151SS52_CAJCA|nr:Auxin-responsive protein IAA30 [Cajanus cajan]